MSTKTKPIESHFSQLRWKSRPSRVIASSWPSNRPFLGAIFANKPTIRCGPKWSVMSSSHMEFVRCEKTCLSFFLTVFHNVLLTFRNQLVIWEPPWKFWVVNPPEIGGNWRLCITHGWLWTGSCGAANSRRCCSWRAQPFWVALQYLFHERKSIKWIMPNPLKGEVYKMHFLLWVPTLRQKGGSL